MTDYSKEIGNLNYQVAKGGTPSSRKDSIKKLQDFEIKHWRESMIVMHQPTDYGQHRKNFWKYNSDCEALSFFIKIVWFAFFAANLLGLLVAHIQGIETVNEATVGYAKFLLVIFIVVVIVTVIILLMEHLSWKKFRDQNPPNKYRVWYINDYENPSESTRASDMFENS